MENGAGLFERRAGWRGHQPLAGHQVAHRLFDILDEAEVAVGQDTDQAALVFGDGNSGDVIPLHDRQGVGHPGVGRQGDWLDDHARFGAFDLVDLEDLILDREIPVQDADPTLARQGDREPPFRDRIHGRREDRHIEHDSGCDPGAGVDIRRDDIGRGREQEDIVEGQAEPCELVSPHGSAGELQLERGALDLGESVVMPWY